MTSRPKTWSALSHAPASEIRDLQDRLFARYVREELYPFSAHYRRVFDEAKIRPRDVRKVSDLRRLPFSTKQDLLAAQSDPARKLDFILIPSPEKIRDHWPFSRKLAVALGGARAREILRRDYTPSFLTFTTGRSSAPVVFSYTSHDIDLLAECGARFLDVFAVPERDTRILSVFPYAPHLAFWQVFSAGEATGMMVLSTGGGKVMGSSGDLRAISRLRAEALIGVPGYIYHLLRRGVADGIDLSAIKVVVLGAERVPPGLKRKIGDLLALLGARDVRVFGTYGFTEARMAFAECPTPGNEYTGYHLYPDLAVFEVVDPKTGEVVPEGHDGELVFTPLQARASCVFRYRTGDLVRGGIRYEPCPHCGRTVPRISSDLTRESSLKDLQLLKVKGTLVNLEDCAMLLGSMPEIEEWQVELRKKDDDPLEVDELIVHLALRHDGEREATATKVREAFKGRLEVAPNRVEFLGLDAMLRKIGMETEMKEKRFVDARPKT